MYNAFTLVPYKRFDKMAIIQGPEDIRLYVDRDDVNTYVIDEIIPFIVQELNFAFDRHGDEFAMAVATGRKKSGLDE